MADKCKFLLNMTKNIEQHTADCKGLDVTVNHKIKLLYKQTNMLIPSKQYPSNAWKVPLHNTHVLDTGLHTVLL